MSNILTMHLLLILLAGFGSFVVPVHAAAVGLTGAAAPSDYRTFHVLDSALSVAATDVKPEPMAEPEPPFVPYTGPCGVSNCGVNGLDCRKKGQLCVPWPHMDLDKRKGCTCSYG